MGHVCGCSHPNAEGAKVIGKKFPQNNEIDQGQGQLSDGYVKKTFKNGQVYEGNIKYGKINGKGKYTHSNGDIYEGEFRDNKAHGFGTFIKKEGGQIEGNWERDFVNGFAVESWKNGDKYSGNYVMGVK